MRLNHSATVGHWPGETSEHHAGPVARDWSCAGACVCLGGGLLAGLLGSVLTAISWFEGAGSFQRAGTALLLLLIPLLLAGAHCFDLMEQREKRGRESHLNEHE